MVWWTLFIMLMFKSYPVFEESLRDRICILNILPTGINFMIPCNDWQPNPKSDSQKWLPIGSWIYFMFLVLQFWVSTLQMCAHVYQTRSHTEHVLKKFHQKLSGNRQWQLLPATNKKNTNFPFLFLAVSHLVTPRNVTITTHLFKIVPSPLTFDTQKEQSYVLYLCDDHTLSLVNQHCFKQSTF